jgi:type IX secretion system PorP/SprF family membrane protein
MKSLLIKIASLVCVIVYTSQVFSQQDEQMSFYAFNPLQFNAAYAGTRGDISITGISRAQWVGVKGAPQTQFISVHSPIKAKNMALGLNLTNDIIGARRRTSVYGNYAYTLRINEKSRLNLGVSFGGDMMAVDFSSLQAKDPSETDYLRSFTQTNFNIGTGIYYHTDRFYAGVSSPRLIQTKLEDENTNLSAAFIKRHYFFTTGYVFNINSIVDLKTSTLIKYTPNAPVTIDVNANAFINKKWWLGAMYRFHECVGMNFAYQHNQSIMFGYHYDFPINGLSTVRNLGSHEIMIRYEFNKNNLNASPRFF